MGKKILIVDDEASIRDAIATTLRYEGFEPTEAEKGRLGLQLAQEHNFDLIILDIMLPDLDGEAVAKRLRQSNLHTPIIFLTAKDSLDDKVQGLNLGADDYIVKPFALSELLARINAVLRRYGQQDKTSQPGVLQYSDISLNEETHEAFRSKNKLDLSPTEFRLLRYFLLNPNRVLSKEQIVDNVWHYDFDGDYSVVETYMSYLRKKLDKYGKPIIKTIRLVGYILKED